MTITLHKHILIIADIEGSSGCFSYAASSLLTKEWPAACMAMSRDVNAVAAALFDAGAETVTVKDFHRTGYNLFPELIDPRVHISGGYRRGPVPGIGDPGPATGLIMMGMHAPSGSGGFLAHTFTSRIARLEVNGTLTGEAELFSASLAPFGLRPLFFSGCPVACEYAVRALPCIAVYPIEKSHGREKFDAGAWRAKLARAAAASLFIKGAEPHIPAGPFEAVLTMRDGAASAKRHAVPWKFEYSGERIVIQAPDFASLYFDLIRLCYLSPVIERALPLLLPLYNFFGKNALLWAKRALRKSKNSIDF